MTHREKSTVNKLLKPSQHFRKTPLKKERLPNTRIQASYGGNLRLDQVGNATDILQGACDGKRNCSFAVNVASDQIGDHSPGQKKDFRYTYVFGDQEKKGVVDAEAQREDSLLTCALQK
jgi:hypothetical protein